ncbi:MAG TPA: ammonia-forming cytochrome c nitrite reductase subunit c552 [Candidatus Sumerlaeota bacterium]|nr:ammonia-forming cytochrome c nitrite reductase subunit c552 [Candidatus Sumerlaeota bacterium]HPK02902.1 ammonia-forming cytochrome c nitrite reductase subunit c552 [Candidatus Sumerlaeota bacterium]
MTQPHPSDQPGALERRVTGGRFIALVLAIAIFSGIVTLAITALLMNIQERKQEARNPFFRVVELDDMTVDPAVWGKNFPLQYDMYLKTVDMQRTRFGGSEAMVRRPTDADPRTQVAQSKLEEDPRLATMWAGYAFAIDFREERGHAYMLEDQTYTQRHQKEQAGTCLHCHASTYVPYKIAGDGDLIAGFEKFNPLPYFEARKQMETIMTETLDDPHGLHPVACIDCHDPETMALRVTRPGFLEGIAAFKREVEGIDNYDPNTMATRQEMRTFVCGQCHVEYYFKGEGKRLTYPWTNGLRGDQILAYYEETGFADWTHAETGAQVLKAQHPEFEMYNQGIHARSGVACADCHMPYVREGALKVSDHHVRSPLLNINNACQTCHNFPEAEMKERAELIQSRFFEMRDLALDGLVELIAEIKAARQAGVGDEQLRAAQGFQRKSQFLIDFCEAENSMGFHAPQESARLLTQALDYVRQGQLALRGSVAATSGATGALPPSVESAPAPPQPMQPAAPPENPPDEQSAQSAPASESAVFNEG